MEAPRRERIAEGQANDGRRRDYAHEHSCGDREISRRLQYKKHHGERGADDSRCNRSHADEEKREILNGEMRIYQSNDLRKRAAEQAAEKQR